ncbi:MAG TPA: S8 family serine peptidase, partial [Phycisphaerae bacterium]|nr:S8 family serine peptidase [Phycisphaerae bacterium]
MGRANRLFVWIVVAMLCPASLRAQTTKPLYLHNLRIDPSTLPNLKSADLQTSRETYVIQLSGPMTKAMRAQLDAAGVRLADYLPENSYLADLSGVKKGALRRLSFVHWVGRFQQTWKNADDLGQRVFTTPERLALAAQGKSAVMLTLFAGRAGDSTIAALKQLTGARMKYVERVAGNVIISADVRTEDLDSLSRLNDVQCIEEAPEITPRNSTNRWIVQSGVQDVTPFYDHGIAGQGQILGLMDYNVDSGHCSFFDTNPIGPTHRKILAYNAPLGYSNHGTHVAGIAVGDNGVFDETRGIAYLAKMVYSYVPDTNEASIYSKLTLAHSQGATVHSNSYGVNGNQNYDGLARGVDSFAYDNENDLVVFAVTDNLVPTANPENSKNCVAVNAGDTPPNGSIDSVCNGGVGPTADGRRKPDIVGPGCNIISALSGSGCGTIPQGGTSMACPAVAAAAMLARQYYMQGFYPSGVANPSDAFTPSGALLKATLMNSGVDMTGVAGYPTNLEGWGRVLLHNACTFAGDSRHSYIPADIRNADGLSTGQEVTYTFKVIPSSEPLRATLVWTEPPASASTGIGPAWINDLDLELTAPSSTVYLGNVFLNGVTTTGGSKDGKNNVEQIHLPSPETGIWTAKVKAAAVNVGTQGYALMFSGGVFPILPPPSAGAITPNTGGTEASISITDLAGTNFMPGATVKLRRTGWPDVNAILVNVVNSGKITCQFNLFGTIGGAWDVVVKNPDLQEAVLAGGFLVTVDCLKGDLNQDGLVDGADIQRFVEILTGSGADPTEHCSGDVSPLQDGVIGMDDVTYFASCILLGDCTCGLTDDDGDGVNNCNDHCPNTPNGEIVNTQGCSCSQLIDPSCNDADPCTLDSCSAGVCSHVSQDADGDGVCDAHDQCPNTPVGEAADANGCSCSQRDGDADGVNDCLDQCPGTPAGEIVNAQGCSCSQLIDPTCNDADPCTLDSCNAGVCSNVFQDADGDGVCDANDQCPNTPVGEAADVNGCSCSQRDGDADGVNDCLDQCPATPAGESVNGEGCSCTQLPDPTCNDA